MTATTIRSEPRRPRRDRVVLLWAGIAAVAGIAIRVWLLRLPTGVLDSDEAVVGLIARHALYDREFSTFFWGQAYGGTIEPLLAVPGFAIFGPTVFALKAVPILLS